MTEQSDEPIVGAPTPPDLMAQTSLILRLGRNAVQCTLPEVFGGDTASYETIRRGRQAIANGLDVDTPRWVIDTLSWRDLRGPDAASVGLNPPADLVMSRPTALAAWYGVTDDREGDGVAPLSQTDDALFGRAHGGLHVVMGDAGRGKSLTLAALTRYLRESPALGADVRYLAFGEPEAVSQAPGPFLRSLLATILELGLSGAARRVLLVDSLRYFTFSGGAAGKGGVSVELFRDLTSVDAVARLFDVHLVAVWNPMLSGLDESERAEQLQTYAGMVRGAVEGVYVFDTTPTYSTSGVAVTFGTSHRSTDRRERRVTLVTQGGPLSAASITFSVN